MTFQEGNTFGEGRKEGSKNKLNIDIKNAFDIVFNEMGGEKALLDWAKGHKGRFYEIWAKMNPKKLEGTIRPHEDFIKYLQEQDAKRLEESGKPFKMIECPGEEQNKQEEKGKKKQTPPIKVLPNPEEEG